MILQRQMGHTIWNLHFFSLKCGFILDNFFFHLSSPPKIIIKLFYHVLEMISTVNTQENLYSEGNQLNKQESDGNMFIYSKQYMGREDATFKEGEKEQEEILGTEK